MPVGSWSDQGKLENAADREEAGLLDCPGREGSSRLSTLPMGGHYPAETQGSGPVSNAVNKVGSSDRCG